jgi:hypothetical protein
VSLQRCSARVFGASREEEDGAVVDGVGRPANARTSSSLGGRELAIVVVAPTTTTTTTRF